MQSEYARKNKEKVKASTLYARLSKKYKLGKEAYLEKMEEQGWRCAICRKFETRNMKDNAEPRLCMDDHKTGKVRDLLCHACNHMLGCADDNPERLRAAAAYLERHRGG